MCCITKLSKTIFTMIIHNDHYVDLNRVSTLSNYIK